MRELPELSFETIKRMEDMSWFTHAQIFDDLLIVAQRETCCYVWSTAHGLVVFDGIWPDERAYDAITEAIREAGWGGETLTAFDSGLERIAYSRSRMKHLPNIYLLSESGVQQFCEVFRKVAE